MIDTPLGVATRPGRPALGRAAGAELNRVVRRDEDRDRLRVRLVLLDKPYGAVSEAVGDLEPLGAGALVGRDRDADDGRGGRRQRERRENRHRQGP
jgi:hypothetical protein